jgi:hypothetical protein
MGAQAADAAIRRELGVTGLDDVVARAVRVDGDLTTTRLQVAGHGVREVVVRRVPGEATYQLTCSARRENAVARHEVVEVREAS